MKITYDRIIDVNKIDKVTVEGVEKVSCHKNNIYYWLIGQPKFMFRLNLFDGTVENVRITNGKPN